MEALLASGKKASELSDEITIYPQVLVNAVVANENKKFFMMDPEVKDKIHAAEEELKGTGRVLIRPSGTEPVARVMLEGEDTERLKVLAEDIAAVISRKFSQA